MKNGWCLLPVGESIATRSCDYKLSEKGGYPHPGITYPYLWVHSVNPASTKGIGKGTRHLTIN
jgi:hypothetical protein